MGTISRLVTLDLLELEPCGWYPPLPCRHPAASDAQQAGGASPGIAPCSWV